MPNIRLLDLDINLAAREIEDDEADGFLSETGPWTVAVWPSRNPNGIPRVVLCSDDFTHDASLDINGDFRDLAQKIRYAKRLADRMNRMPAE